jgi:hypothetical protein
LRCTVSPNSLVWNRERYIVPPRCRLGRFCITEVCARGLPGASWWCWPGSRPNRDAVVPLCLNAATTLVVGLGHTSLCGLCLCGYEINVSSGYCRDRVTTSMLKPLKQEEDKCHLERGMLTSYVTLDFVADWYIGDAGESMYVPPCRGGDEG